ncbi:hypothetical protein Tcan_07665 [Toxocara canis]|uniref:Uncharacterized protein n=1 Tax=Toxocara canis TaxID=6265 RepID=A0A0B2VUE9_TOXCA|nr:hypothetical protein Tcan_07665 [Toxocara canis]
MNLFLNRLHKSLRCSLKKCIAIRIGIEMIDFQLYRPAKYLLKKYVLVAFGDIRKADKDLGWLRDLTDKGGLMGQMLYNAIERSIKEPIERFDLTDCVIQLRFPLLTDETTHEWVDAMSWPQTILLRNIRNN